MHLSDHLMFTTRHAQGIIAHKSENPIGPIGSVCPSQGKILPFAGVLVPWILPHLVRAKCEPSPLGPSVQGLDVISLDLDVFLFKERRKSGRAVCRGLRLIALKDPTARLLETVYSTSPVDVAAAPLALAPQHRRTCAVFWGEGYRPFRWHLPRCRSSFRDADSFDWFGTRLRLPRHSTFRNGSDCLRFVLRNFICILKDVGKDLAKCIEEHVADLPMQQ